MKPELLEFKITPQIVEADKETTVEIQALDGNFRFFDDLTYKIEALPMEESDVPIDYEMTLNGYSKARHITSLKPENGVLRFSYRFIGEQEWRIHIFCEEYEKYQNPMYCHYPRDWAGLIDAPKYGIILSIYSLYPDLYCRRALKCDFHLHSSISDGAESPALTAAGYRKGGYDVMALTEHHAYNSARFAKEKFDFKTDFKILCGEEVHNRYLGNFHMVNLMSEKSVNEVYLNDPERVEREASALASEVKVPEGLNAHEYLHRVWLYREAKKSGGFVIFAHPFWDVYNRYHTETAMTRAILNNGLCDAYELLGGVSPEGNHLQASLYASMRAEGLNIPIVGSTDCHSIFSKSFNTAHTLLFTIEDDITGAISDSYSVAVYTLPGENPQVFGDYRLTKYAYFLLRNYFPVHDELCSASGSVISEYILGNKDLKPVAEALEARVTTFEDKFFGR